MKNRKKKPLRSPKLCLVSSSGGHWEQLQKLKPLTAKYPGFFVTERTRFPVPKDTYRMLQTDGKDPLMPAKMIWNSLYALYIWMREKPDLVITTGTWWPILFTFFRYCFIRNLSLSRLLPGQICPQWQDRKCKNMRIFSLSSGKVRNDFIQTPSTGGVYIDFCDCGIPELSL